MPIYSYRCEACDIANVEEFRHVASRNDCPPCPNCGAPTSLNVIASGTNVRGDYKQPIVSDSLGFSEEDVAEHRQRFPEIELVISEGCARPKFRSLSQRRKYLDAINWADVKDYR